MSTEGLGRHRIHGVSFAFHLAQELELPHAYCDPPKKIRGEQQIVSHSDRERYWLDQLRSFAAFPCLFWEQITSKAFRSYSTSLISPLQFCSTTGRHQWTSGLNQTMRRREKPEIPIVQRRTPPYREEQKGGEEEDETRLREAIVQITGQEMAKQDLDFEA